jgi:MFS transporter, ACS family, D-galactonate transporter
VYIAFAFRSSVFFDNHLAAGGGTMPDPTGAMRPSERNHTLAPALAPAVALLAISSFINYIDRGNLAIAAPLLKDELHLSPWQLGILLSSFFWTYAFFQVVSGWLVDRFNANWIIAIGFSVWSVATAATGLVHGFVLLLVVRLILGIGESTAYPSYSKIFAKHFPETHRGRANALVAAGLSCGPAFGTFLGGLLMAKYGWRPFFVVLGVVSLLWLPPWLKWMPRGPGLPSLAPKLSPPILEILAQRSAWGTFGGLFATNYLNYFLITWLPTYLVNERHFSMQGMAKLGGGALFAAALSTTISGWLADRWTASGGTPTRVRKTFTGLGLACASVIVVVSVVSDQRLASLFLFVACISFGLCTSNLWAITQTLAGPHAAGKWTGVQNFVGNLAGIAAPAVTGFVVQRTGHFFWAFAITAGVLLAGAFSWVFVIGPIEQVRWQSRPASSLAETDAPAT